MGEITSYDKLDSEKRLDENLRTVMPDYWQGHLRLAIYEQSQDRRVVEFALALSEGLSRPPNEYKQSVDELAEAIVSKAESKL